ncbi:dethiobiotin synthetase [Thozetella sp. PMI_491]|nr:dethiobiotin synthetase [Thozetella sp. PMI_491]
MPPVGSILWRSLKVYQVFGANTDVGKTIVTTILCNATTRQAQDGHTAYLKPISTGPHDEADERCSHIRGFVRGVESRTLLQYDLAASPHLAARITKQPVPSDDTLLSEIHSAAARYASSNLSWLFIETAGGVHSPGPSGTTQADLYMPLRLPVVLVGDSKLGGISQTISAFEALKIRGYDVEAVLLFRDTKYENYTYLADYFGEKHGIPVTAVASPPERNAIDPASDRMDMMRYYEAMSRDISIQQVLEKLGSRHHDRIARLESMAHDAERRIWYPFTQQKHLTADKITVIDSAQGDYFQTFTASLFQAPTMSAGRAIETTAPTNPVPLLRPSFDGSASWWTQGLGHGNAELGLAAAYAAGRYGHVMFAETIHEPALTLANELVRGMANPRLTRVFFSDNGSTGAEVAIKMALRATRLRYGWSAGEKLDIVGLKGSYHGDTMGAMNCAEPSTFNEKVEWYEGRGFWFDYPTVQLTEGKWITRIPKELERSLGLGREYSSLEHVFDVRGREARGEAQAYESYITDTLRALQSQGRKFGALILEPVILGAGGMLFVDPLFQRALVNTVRRSAHLFASAEERGQAGELVEDRISWTGLPVVFDEVFTGLYRLGRFSAASFLGVDADVSVHAKLLTGGLVPLCTTLASESIFRAFETDDKSDALLHGHSYTAHAVGCQVAVRSLATMSALDARGDWDWAKARWRPQASESAKSAMDKADTFVWSMWSPEFLDALSRQTSIVDGLWALGSVLAIHVKGRDGGGYKSNAARVIQAALLGAEGTKTAPLWNVHSRVLGNVLYLMASQKTTEGGIGQVEELLRQTFAA